MRVLQAIGAISSIVTVQSDIGASAADIERIAADARLHVHLLPYQQGLRMRILVRPLPDTGAYYAPGSGAERVIADFNGVRTEAKRDLNAEREAERQLVGACHALEGAEPEHDEWLLGSPIACLELVSELQELDAGAGRDRLARGRALPRQQEGDVEIGAHEYQARQGLVRRQRRGA